MIYDRLLDLSNLLKYKSFFLFGPRASGKTSLINRQLSNARVFDLLDMDTYARLTREVKIIEQSIQNQQEVIVIDEVQKMPSLLNEVHRLMNTYKSVRFLLTGSSARSLRKRGVNLLAGRAWQAEMFPLVSSEITDFDLVAYINKGGLPDIYSSNHPREDLRSYVNTYLKEEVQAEALTRNLSAFSHFLDAIALSNAQELNFDSLASDCGVSPVTLKNYVQILEDTLLGFPLPGFRKTKTRKAISRAKHYLFDLGVTNQLCKRGEIMLGSELFGSAFEHFIILETRAWNSYSRNYHELFYWRSTSKFEVDLIIGSLAAIEIKSTTLVQDKHLKGLRALKEEGLIKKYIIVSLDPEHRKTKDGIEIMPWDVYLQGLWGSRQESLHWGDPLMLQ